MLDIPICPICKKHMNIVLNKNRIDGYESRCHRRNPHHDLSHSIRKNSIFEEPSLPLQGLFCLCFQCFAKNYTIEQSRNEVLQLMKTNCGFCKESIIKLYKKLRRKLPEKIKDIGNSILLGLNQQKREFQRWKQTKHI